MDHIGVVFLYRFSFVSFFCLFTYLWREFFTSIFIFSNYYYFIIFQESFFPYSFASLSCVWNSFRFCNTSSRSYLFYIVWCVVEKLFLLHYFYLHAHCNKVYLHWPYFFTRLTRYSYKQILILAKYSYCIQW